MQKKLVSNKGSVSLVVKQDDVYIYIYIYLTGIEKNACQVWKTVSTRNNVRIQILVNEFKHAFILLDLSGLPFSYH